MFWIIFSHRALHFRKHFTSWPSWPSSPVLALLPSWPSSASGDLEERSLRHAGGERSLRHAGGLNDDLLASALTVLEAGLALNTQGSW